MRQILFLFFSLLLAFACNSCKDDDLIQDTSKIKSFHEHYYLTEKHHLSKSVDLFIDYSTCLSNKETKNSVFYKAIHPKIIDCNPSFWSIKGDVITKESGDIYQLLNSINEVNYADLKSAVEIIVKGNNQAILITDGEYYQQNTTGANNNNPYLSESFEKWLMAGHDIYIYSENYKEANRWDKKRYYFLFTDRDIEDNIYHKLSKGVKLNDPVHLTKLSSTDFKVYTKYDGASKPKVNEVLSFNSSSYFADSNFEFQEYQIDWSDIVKYIEDATNPNTGTPMIGGDFILRGIYVDTKSLDYFTIEDIDVKVYNAFDAFRYFEDTSHLPRTDKLKEIEELFTIDKEAFKTSGEVVLKFHKNFTGAGLNSKEDNPRKENLLKVDIVISKAKDNFKEKINDFNYFNFTSIDGKLNTSLYHSIKNTLEDECINPKKVNKGILYTIYIKTPTSNL